MTSYKFARRNFFAGTSAAIGLHTSYAVWRRGAGRNDRPQALALRITRWAPAATLGLPTGSGPRTRYRAS